MVEHAEIVRIESQLTIPSRHYPHLRDYWISIAWKAGNDQWMRAFADIAAPVDAVPTAYGSLSVVPLSPAKGWIVARGVDGKLVRPTDLEAKVRALASEVNALLAEAPVLVARSPAPSALLPRLFPKTKITLSGNELVSANRSRSSAG